MLYGSVCVREYLCAWQGERKAERKRERLSYTKKPENFQSLQVFRFPRRRRYWLGQWESCEGRSRDGPRPMAEQKEIEDKTNRFCRMKKFALDVDVVVVVGVKSCKSFVCCFQKQNFDIFFTHHRAIYLAYLGR